jgi:hypothetical protein
MLLKSMDLPQPALTMPNQEIMETTASSRLTSLLPVTGGGLQPKKNDFQTTSQRDHRGDGKSLLGLDRLAAARRQEEQQQKQHETLVNSTSKPAFVKRSVPQRPYRDRHHQVNETPSHPGGLNQVAVDRTQRQQHRKYQQYRHQLDNNRYDDETIRKRHRTDNDDDSNIDRMYSRQNRGSSMRRDGERQDDSRQSSKRREYNDDADRRRGNSERHWGQEYYNRSSNNRRPHGDMPPPVSRNPTVSAITPSTNASMSTTRQRKNDTVFSATPMTQSRNQNRTNQSNTRRSRSDWDVETPMQGARDDVDGLDPTKGIPQADDAEFDRQFYLDEDDDGNYVADQSGQNDMGRFLFENAKTKAREEEMDQKSQKIGIAR